MNILKDGIGQDGELVQLEKFHNACFLVHTEGNSQSPFEFFDLPSAEQFMAMIAKFRMKDRLINLIED